MVRTNQGGSVLSFVVIGIVAGLLFIGSAYVVRQQIANPEPSQPQTATNKPEETKKQAEPDKQNKDKTTNPQKNDEQVNNNDPAVAPPQAAPAPGSNSKNTLPQTGSSEGTGPVIIVGLLCAAVFYYLRSRRPELSL